MVKLIVSVCLFLLISTNAQAVCTVFIRERGETTHIKQTVVWLNDNLPLLCDKDVHVRYDHNLMGVFAIMSDFETHYLILLSKYFYKVDASDKRSILLHEFVHVEQAHPMHVNKRRIRPPRCQSLFLEAQAYTVEMNFAHLTGISSQMKTDILHQLKDIQVKMQINCIGVSK